MVKKNTIVARIDPKLDFKIKNLAAKNNFSYPQASKVIAKQLDDFEYDLKKCKKKFKMDIKF